MPVSVSQKKLIVMLAFAAAIILVITILPFVETALRDWIYAYFGLTVLADGSVVTAEGASPHITTATTLGLVFNLFNILKILLWMALVIFIVRIVFHLIFATALRGSAEGEITSLIRTILSIIVYIVAFFIIFQSQYPNVQLTALFTGSTIVGIVVGLALQDTLGNLFAGIALQADQPFQVGDVVAITNQGMGKVESVSWRGVKIRTFQNKLLVISNAVLGKETIEVAPRDNLNARLVFFSTRFDNSPTRTIQSVRDAVRQVENVSQKMRPVVRIRELSDLGIEWEVKYWCEDYAKHNETDALIRQRIWYVFQREGIDFAYPTRTVYMEEHERRPGVEEYTERVAEQVARVPIFQPLSDNELEAIARSSKKRIFAPGEAIVRRGGEGNSMFIITRGSVKVQVPVKEGVRTVSHLGANDFFGEMSLLTGEPRSATVAAEEETEVLEIRSSALKPILEKNPTLAEAISSLVDERRELLSPDSTPDAASTEQRQKSVLNSLRKFFGIND